MDFDPLRFPPAGVTSHFVDPRFLGLPLLVTAGVCLPLVLLFAAVRIYARLAVDKTWKLNDYVLCLTCAAGVALIAFTVPFVLSKPNGYRAYDVQLGEIDKAALLNRHALFISLGPVLWLIKLSLFGFLLDAFGSVRWFKNCSFIGIVASGLIFATYTIIATMTCGPLPESNARSYLNGLNRKDCSSSNGLLSTIGLFMVATDSASNVYLMVLPLPLIPKMGLTSQQRNGIYLIQIVGLLGCASGLAALFYRIKSRQSTDVTGSQIPFIAAIIIEVAMSLIVTSMPSLLSVWRHYAYPDLTDVTPSSTPNMRLVSSMSTVLPSLSPPPPTESRSTWRKAHHSVDDLPYRKASSEYSRYQNSPHDPRMKALPKTPLPLTVPPSPQTPLSPTSARSMQLQIMMHSSVR
ncbi:hypothetical protein BS50DRAFT_24051 [Corynespora cassiicola Philippines]|uniref:Rhodopsin domain-containing protein n=1 Tax=Corynespora cassiicola Philippines TaxID=1448308 RepID=A0A2T2PAU7_CORCC|nr:hypothetical protein BS50DRAFT_24051 [Corynespora cassiicola Philippines]